MARYRCYLCPCTSPGPPGRFREFEADAPVCPKCGAGEPAVLELVDVHMLVPDPKGPIPGHHGRRWRVGCEPKREALALHEADTYSATIDPRAVTCPSCLGLPEWAAAAALFKELRQALIAPGKTTCCD